MGTVDDEKEPQVIRFRLAACKRDRYHVKIPQVRIQQVVAFV